MFNFEKFDLNRQALEQYSYYLWEVVHKTPLNTLEYFNIFFQVFTTL